MTKPRPITDPLISFILFFLPIIVIMIAGIIVLIINLSHEVD
jgi:hypothetical protein